MEKVLEFVDSIPWWGWVLIALLMLFVPSILEKIDSFIPSQAERERCREDELRERLRRENEDPADA